MPPRSGGAGPVQAAPPVTRMPHCLVHATPHVRVHLLTAGADCAGDVAGWWRSVEDIRTYGQQRGWDEADLGSAELAWLEAARPQARSRPDVAVPEAVTNLKTKEIPASPGEGQLSLSALAPTRGA